MWKSTTHSQQMCNYFAMNTLHKIILLTIVVQSKTLRTEIPTNSDLPALQNPDPDNSTLVKFACNIYNVSTFEPICSGSIISPHFLVSSCLMCLTKHGQPVPSAEIEIAVPQFSEKKFLAIGILYYNVEHVHIHPRCIFKGKYDAKHDIGIVQTTKEIEFDKNTVPAKIPQAPDFHYNTSQDLMVSTIQLRDTTVTTLDEALWYIEVKTIPPNACSSVLNNTDYDLDKLYCTPYYHAESTDNDCKTDYGASLSTDTVLVGILIHKLLCGLPESVANFVNVTLNAEWIMASIQQLSVESEST